MDAQHLASLVGFQIPEGELADYESMLSKAVAAFELVEGMEGSSVIL